MTGPYPKNPTTTIATDWIVFGAWGITGLIFAIGVIGMLLLLSGCGGCVIGPNGQTGECF